MYPIHSTMQHKFRPISLSISAGRIHHRSYRQYRRRPSYRPPAHAAIGYRVKNYCKGYVGLLNLVFTGIRKTLDCNAEAGA